MTTCPIAFETLVELWSGELDPAAADAIEAHVFACDACASSYARVGELVGALTGLVPPIISAVQRERLAASGVRIVVTPVTPDHVPTARFAPEVDLLVHALRGDLSGARRVDVELVMSGQPFLFENVPFDGDAGEVLVACQRHFEAFGPTTFRVYAVADGERRLVGDYDVAHVWR